MKAYYYSAIADPIGQKPYFPISTRDNDIMKFSFQAIKLDQALFSLLI